MTAASYKTNLGLISIQNSCSRRPASMISPWTSDCPYSTPALLLGQPFGRVQAADLNTYSEFDSSSTNHIIFSTMKRESACRVVERDPSIKGHDMACCTIAQQDPFKDACLPNSSRLRHASSRSGRIELACVVHCRRVNLIFVRRSSPIAPA